MTIDCVLDHARNGGVFRVPGSALTWVLREIVPDSPRPKMAILSRAVQPDRPQEFYLADLEPA